MNRQRFWTATTAIMIVLFSLAACGSDTSPDVSHLEAEMAALRSEIATLRTQAQATPDVPAPTEEPSRASQQDIARLSAELDDRLSDIESRLETMSRAESSAH